MATAFRGSQTRGALTSVARQTSQFEIGAQTSGRRSRHWPDNEQKETKFGFSRERVARVCYFAFIYLELDLLKKL